MKELSKLLSILLITITLSLCFLVGCNIKKEKKYDVTMKVVCSTGEEWIFTPDVEELHWELEYDGIERTFNIAKYKLEKHPRWGDQWFDPSPYGANVFMSYLLYKGEKGWQNLEVRKITQPGEYCYDAYADSTSDLWRYRSVQLYIAVK